jgi:hypothetical protein
MGVIDTLKWLWDPCTEEDKQYKTDPLRRYTQQFYIYIKGIEAPFDRSISFEDVDFGNDWMIRINLDYEVQEWLNRRAEKGVKIDNVWYPSDMIERIELGESWVEEQ